MTTALLQMQASALQLHEQLDYPASGLHKRVLLKDSNCQYALLCLAAGAEIAEHTTPRNATVQVLAGQGTLTISSQQNFARARRVCSDARERTSCSSCQRKFGLFTDVLCASVLKSFMPP